MTVRAALVLVGITTVAGLAGCRSAAEEQRSDVLNSPTPELAYLQRRPVDGENRAVRTVNTNWRSAMNDGERFLLLDRPSRMNPEPMR